jgi:hypothetical protein
MSSSQIYKNHFYTTSMGAPPLAYATGISNSIIVLLNIVNPVNLRILYSTPIVKTKNCVNLILDSHFFTDSVKTVSLHFEKGFILFHVRQAMTTTELSITDIYGILNIFHLPVGFAQFLKWKK